MRFRHLAVMLGALCNAAFAASEADIRALMEAGKFSEAYQLGKQSAEHLGEPGFDFYFGIAALDGGSPGEGVLALERFLINYPDNRSAKFHLARGYYILGEDQRARTEFVALLKDADGEEKVLIERFLDAIRGRESRYLPTAGFFIEAGFGHDSNINAGARAGDVSGLPGFIVSAAGSSAREADTFYSLLAGAQGSRPVAPGVMVYGGLQGNGRWHSSSQNDIFDVRGGLAQGGVTMVDGRNLYRGGLEYSVLGLDASNYLTARSLVGEWAHQFDQFNRFGVNLQYSQLRYEDVTVFLDKQKTLASPSGASNRDGNLAMIGGSWTHAVAHAWNPVFSMSASLGEERNDKNRPEYSRDIYGARAALTVQPAEKWSLSAALNYQHSRFKDFFSGNSAFPKRRDDYASLEVGAAYIIDRNWSIRAEGTWVNQQSNIGLYDYERNVVAVKARYDYK